MATRNIDVLLSAENRGFTRALDGAVLSVKKFVTSLTDADQKSNVSIKNINKAATGIAVGLTAAGIAAGVAAVDFDRSLTRIETLVGVASSQVDGFRGSVLALAGQTAKAPVELADALFVVTSAGQRGGEALTTLALSAKASAIGMGETSDIARTTAAIMEAYAGSQITAAQATDILVGTARAGNFETSALAGSLGRVLPNAATLGVAMTDVGGAIALFTRNGAGASQAVTNLDSLLRAFVKPTAEARETLAAYGLTISDVQRTLENDGLVAALQQVDVAFGGNRQLLAKVITDTQGLTGANIILNSTTETLAGTFGVVEDSAGLLGTAFAQLGESDAFKFDQAVNQLGTQLVAFGQNVLPLVVTGIELLGDVFGPISGLIGGAADPVKQFAAGLVILQAAGQPVVSVLAAVGQSAGQAAVGVGKYVAQAAGGQAATGGFASAQASLKGALDGVNFATLGITVALTAGVLLWKQYKDQQREAEARARDLTSALDEQGGSLPTLVANLNDTVTQLVELASASGAAGDDFGSISQEVAKFSDLLTDLGTDGGAEAFTTLGLSVQDLLPLLQSGTDDFQGFQNILGAFDGGNVIDAFGQIRENVKLAQFENEDFILGLVDQAEQSGVSVASLRDLIDVLDESSDAYDDVTTQQRTAALQAVLLAEETGEISAAQAEAARSAIVAAQNYSELAGAVLGADNSFKQSALSVDELALANIKLTGTGRFLAAEYENVAPALRRTGEELEILSAAGIAEAEQMVALQEANRDVADSYDVLAQAISPWRQFLDASVGDVIGLTQAHNDATLSVERFADQIESGSVAALGAEGGSVAATTNALIGYGNELRGRIVDLVEAGASQAEVTARSDELRASFIEQAEALGFSGDEAAQYADQLLGIPPEVLTQMILDRGAAREQLDALLIQVERLGNANPEVVLSVDDQQIREDVAANLLLLAGLDARSFVASLGADSSDLQLEYAAAILKLNGLEDEQIAVLLQGDDADLQAAVTAALSAIDDVDGSVANARFNVDTTVNSAKVPVGTVRGFSGQGNILMAEGGVIERYANGGIRSAESHVAQIAPAGAMRVWAEPETGGEAYIPLAQGKRSRSTAIARDVANRFGYDLVPRVNMANGGILNMANGGAVTFGATGSGINVDVVVNVAGGTGGTGGTALGGGGSDGGNVIVEAGAVVVNGAELGDSAQIVGGVTDALERLCGRIRSGSTSSTGVTRVNGR